MIVIHLASKKETTLDVGKVSYLKLTKREILVKIWLTSADGDRKEAKNKKTGIQVVPKRGKHA